MIDNYRKGWALRFIREANDDIEAFTRIFHSQSFVANAARKAQTAIYFSLGDPYSIENIIIKKIDEKKLIENPILLFLVDVEETIRNIERLPSISEKEVLKEAKEIINIASSVINLFINND